MGAGGGRVLREGEVRGGGNSREARVGWWQRSAVQDWERFAEALRQSPAVEQLELRTDYGCDGPGKDVAWVAASGDGFRATCARVGGAVECRDLPPANQLRGCDVWAAAPVIAPPAALDALLAGWPLFGTVHAMVSWWGDDPPDDPLDRAVLVVDSDVKVARRGWTGTETAHRIGVRGPTGWLLTRQPVGVGGYLSSAAVGGVLPSIDFGPGMMALVTAEGFGCSQGSWAHRKLWALRPSARWLVVLAHLRVGYGVTAVMSGRWSHVDLNVSAAGPMEIDLAVSAHSTPARAPGSYEDSELTSLRAGAGRWRLVGRRFVRVSAAAP